MKFRRESAIEYGILQGAGEAPLSFEGRNAMASAQRIDIHHHIWPPRWLEEPPDWLSGRSGDMAPTTNWDFVSKWTPSMTIDAMGKNDVATTVTSVSSMVVHPDKPQYDADFARECNEFGP